MASGRNTLLTVAEAACLDAIRSGGGTQSVIALQAKLTLKEALSSITKLAAAGLVICRERHRWEATPRGKRAVVTTMDNPERSRGGKRFGEIRPGTSSERLLALLDRPRRGPELAKELAISLQRVHQLVIRLSALDLVRVGDQEHPLHIVCRANDDSLLLRIKEEKVLSALPLGPATTAQKIGIATSLSGDDVIGSIRYLVEQGLIEREGASKHGELYTLTGAGADHWQRRRAGRRADLPPLPVRSERIREVLSYLVRKGPTRTRDVGEALDVSPTSINALMQYLKRKRLVRKSDTTLTAPYEVTDHGRKTLADMTYHQMDLAA